MKEWLELLRRLGDALLDLATAEVDALSTDLRHGGAQAVRALVLALVAGVLAALAWALFTLALVWGLANVIGLWQSALVVGAVYATVALACALLARRRWQAIEPPFETVRRRVEEQRTWFRDRILDLPLDEGAQDEAERARLAGES